MPSAERSGACFSLGHPLDTEPADWNDRLAALQTEHRGSDEALLRHSMHLRLKLCVYEVYLFACMIVLQLQACTCIFVRACIYMMTTRAHSFARHLTMVTCWDQNEPVPRADKGILFIEVSLDSV